MTAIPGTGQERPDGLRERKKAKTRAAIRDHALRLFRENGYQRTTVEKIAEAAELAAEGTEPPADLNASQDYKRHLARVLTKRALLAASK